MNPNLPPYQISFSLKELAPALFLPIENIDFTPLTTPNSSFQKADSYGSLIQSNKDPKEMLWVSDLQSSFDMFTFAHANREKLIHGAKQRGRHQDADFLVEFLVKDKSGKRGGSVQDVLDMGKGNWDLSQFNSAKSKVNAVSSEIEKYLTKTRPGRRRVFSAEDGDFQRDREFDIFPFASTSRQEALSIPKLIVVCNISFAWHYTDDFIAEHCALAWALVDMFEKVGILCSVYVTFFSSGLSDNINRLQYLVELKKHDAYVSAVNIARGMTTSFYRRIGFLGFVRIAALLDSEANPGLGRPDEQTEAPLLKNGVLLITSRVTSKVQELGPEKGADWLLKEMMPGLLEMGLQ